MQDVYTQAAILRRRWFRAAMTVAALITASCGSAGASSHAQTAAPPVATSGDRGESPNATPTPTAVGVAAETLAAGAAAVHITMVVDESVAGGNRFTPEAVTVHMGQVVEWGDYDRNSLDDHNVVFTDHPELSTPTLAFGQKPNGSPGLSTWQARFTTPGTFRYVCTFHLPGMTGTITVLP